MKTGRKIIDGEDYTREFNGYGLGDHVTRFAGRPENVGRHGIVTSISNMFGGTIRVRVRESNGTEFECNEFQLRLRK